MNALSKTALVTGAARGIGLAIASRLASDGIRVAVLDLDGAAAEAAAKKVGAGAIALTADVTKAADVDAAVRRVVDTWGRLDILVNNAGITGRSFPIWELSEEDWNRVIDADLTSVFLCCRAAVKIMLGQGSGRIINIASIAGKEGNPTLVPYSAAKAGVIGFTKAIAREAARYRVRCNAVAPGPIETPLLNAAPAMLGEIGERLKQGMINATALGRTGEPEEVAAVIAFLAGDEASYVTGQTLNVSGGLSMW